MYKYEMDQPEPDGRVDGVKPIYPQQLCYWSVGWGWGWYNKATTFSSDRMSGSHFIVQTSKFLLIDATALTLVRGHGMVIQYISPYAYILCPKYLRFSSNGFDVRGKSCCGGGRGRNELKT